MFDEDDLGPISSHYHFKDNYDGDHIIKEKRNGSHNEHKNGYNIQSCNWRRK